MNDSPVDQLGCEEGDVGGQQRFGDAALGVHGVEAQPAR